jgi:hypothetical protein
MMAVSCSKYLVKGCSGTILDVKQKLKRPPIKILVIVTLVIIFFLLSVPAVAQGSNDIPGLPISVGQTIEGVVDATTKPNDVYAVELAAGRQINLSISSGGPRDFYVA